jgi:cytochrome P450 family 142 subfamily A polypeptide 1
MEDDLRAQCDAIIDEVCEKGSCDLVRDIASPLPIIVIGNLLGVAPKDRDDLLRWSDDMLKALGSPDPSLMEGAANAFVEYTAYIHPVFEDRRRRGSIDDLVGVLCHATIDGDSLDDDSLVHETLLILIGGDETTRHVISGGTAELRAGATPGGGARPDDGRRRGDVALGLPDQEHGPHHHRRGRVGRHDYPGRQGAAPPLPVGQP